MKATLADGTVVEGTPTEVAEMIRLVAEMIRLVAEESPSTPHFERQLARLGPTQSYGTHDPYRE